MIHGSEPSQLFIDMIHGAYHQEAGAGGIRQGYVPGMRLAMNDRGREIVVHEGTP